MPSRRVSEGSLLLEKRGGRDVGQREVEETEKRSLTGATKQVASLRAGEKTLSSRDVPENAVGDAGEGAAATAAMTRTWRHERDADPHLMMYCLYENTHTCLLRGRTVCGRTG
jgi:hypothetical protein